MKFKIVVHTAEEEGGYWVEVPSLPGCFTQGDNLDEVRSNAKEAILAYLGVDEELIPSPDTQILEIAV